LRETESLSHNILYIVSRGDTMEFIMEEYGNGVLGEAPKFFSRMGVKKIFEIRRLNLYIFLHF